MRLVEEGLSEEGDILGSTERSMSNEFLNYPPPRSNLRVSPNCFKATTEPHALDVICFLTLYMKCYIRPLPYSYR